MYPPSQDGRGTSSGRMPDAGRPSSSDPARSDTRSTPTGLYGGRPVTLLRDVAVERSDQVRSEDITNVPRPEGFIDLAAMIDWYSRYVAGWRLSNTLDGSSCLEMLEEALTGRVGGPCYQSSGGEH